MKHAKENVKNLATQQDKKTIKSKKTTLSFESQLLLMFGINGRYTAHLLSKSEQSRRQPHQAWDRERKRTCKGKREGFDYNNTKNRNSCLKRPNVTGDL